MLIGRQWALFVVFQRLESKLPAHIVSYIWQEFLGLRGAIVPDTWMILLNSETYIPPISRGLFEKGGFSKVA